MLTNILQYLESTVQRVPDKTAFSDGANSLTFSELYRTARSIGSSLIQRGLGGRPVLVAMDKVPAQLAVFFGVVYAGGFYASLDTDMPSVRMDMIRETLKSDVLIYDGQNKKSEKAAKSLQETCGQALALLDWRELSATAENTAALDAVRNNQIDIDPIYVVFTSGSTGVPKGVAACHRSVIDYTESLCEAVGFNEDTVFGNQTPLYFDAPLKEIMPTIKYGATAYLIPKSLFMFPMKLCDYLNEHRINTVCWVVSALTMISSLGVLEKNPPKYLTTVCFGSEVFPRRQYDLWRAALPRARFFNLYGPTEATGMSCYWPATRELAPDESIPIGRPFRNTGILLLTDDGRQAAQGEVGEICMRGTCVTLGYYNNPEKTAEAFIRNPLQTAYPETIYRTGDIGRYNEHGELVFLSRRDAQIKHMGHRIELGEIEAVSQTNESVGQVCCVYDGEARRIVLFFCGTCDEGEISRYLKERLPRYMLPAFCVKLDTLPKTPNGKIDRKGLRERAMAIE